MHCISNFKQWEHFSEKGLILYSQFPDYNAEEAAAFLREQTPDCISGKTVLLERIAQAFPRWTLESAYMSRCNQAEGSPEQPEKLVIRRLETADVPEAIGLLSDIEEFSRTYVCLLPGI